MKKIPAVSTRLAFSFIGLVLAILFSLIAVPRAQGADAWKNSFEDVCSKVDVSSNMSIQELQALIEKADKLVPEIEKSDDPGKKVYLRRLKNCRSMFEFAIDSKKLNEK